MSRKWVSFKLATIFLFSAGLSVVLIYVLSYGVVYLPPEATTFTYDWVMQFDTETLRQFEYAVFGLFMLNDLIFHLVLWLVPIIVLKRYQLLPKSFAEVTYAIAACLAVNLAFFFSLYPTDAEGPYIPSPSRLLAMSMLQPAALLVMLYLAQVWTGLAAKYKPNTRNLAD